jgi:threonylcarbamoyladenosine tRNA methylthiotransferase MtaB
MVEIKTFDIQTLGCKLNFSESSEIARRLTEAGFVRSDNPAYLIVNSCAVTAVAEKKARNLVAHLHRECPDAKIVVVGCYAALRAQEILQWPGVVATFGNEDKMSVVPYLQGETLPEKPAFFTSFSSNDRTRSFLKIQDGCDYHCTYCTVWKARGDSRSDTIENVVAQIERICHLGIKEINLTGVNLGDFGRKSGTDFYQLLAAIERRGFDTRIRISSIEPNLLTDEIIALAAQSNVLMPHFHIPLQSPNDRILGLMRRRYQRDFFASKVLKVKEVMPHACIALDVIAGFPTETEEEFAEGLAFLESLPISYLHVFTYSRRPGTIAADMDGQVPPQVKKDRTNRLIALSEQKKTEFYHQHVGDVRPVLWEAEKKGGEMFGFTDNYIKLKIPYCKEKVNTIEDVEIRRERLAL